MKALQLIIKHKGEDHICLYSPEDRPLIEKYTWSISGGYVVTSINGKSVLMHRLILNLDDPQIHCDHINHCKTDNTRANLRICTPSQNQHNRRKQKSSTNFKGVTLYKQRFFAQIRADNNYHYLGLYRSERTAARVYDQAARRLHGEFACTNNLEPLPKQMRLPI
jgi:hypothetical protein